MSIVTGYVEGSATARSADTCPPPGLDFWVTGTLELFHVPRSLSFHVARSLAKNKPRVRLELLTGATASHQITSSAEALLFASPPVLHSIEQSHRICNRSRYL